MTAEQQKVLETLRRIGGGVRVSELAYKTGLPQSTIIDALDELEAQGLVAPWAWTLGPEARAA